MSQNGRMENEMESMNETQIHRFITDYTNVWFARNVKLFCFHKFRIENSDKVERYSYVHGNETLLYTYNINLSVNAYRTCSGNQISYSSVEIR